MEEKICTKCGESFPATEEYFYWIKKTKLLYSWCRECRRKYQKEYFTGYYKRNKERIKENYENNKEQKKEYQAENRDKITEYQKEYYKNNREKIKDYNKEYRKDNKEKISIKNKKYTTCYTTFTTYASQLTIDEAPRDDGNGYLEVVCTYCGKYFHPTNSSVRNRITILSGRYFGEQRLYCSDGCKDACPIYHQKKWPKGFKPATSREVNPLIRQMCLKRDDYTCQECGATTDEAELHAHHWIGATAYPTLANDVVLTTTFCKPCHEWIHTEIDDCKYSEMTCEAVRAKYAEKP